MRWSLFIWLWIGACLALKGQEVPSAEENFQYISTFGPDADGSYGDDDYFQVFFFMIPRNISSPIYFQIFDPNTGGKHDLILDGANTRTRFELYGGFGAYSDSTAQSIEKTDFISGNLISSHVFTTDGPDDDWLTLGPFNPAEGEFIPNLDAYVFKFVIQGEAGDDGNTYRLRMTMDSENYRAVPGGNAFTYKYTFRLKQSRGSVGHVYPLVGNNVIALQQFNFDFDNEGKMRIFSVDKNGVILKKSGEGEWVNQTLEVSPNENGKSMNIQMLKSGDRINDMTLYILNQYNQAVPLFAIPIGGVPYFKPKFEIQKTYKRNKIYMK